MHDTLSPNIAEHIDQTIHEHKQDAALVQNFTARWAQCSTMQSKRGLIEQIGEQAIVIYNNVNY